ncbi:DUF3145 family protein [Aestuariimicrobium sp. T2.26MG-19.2B]|uniref:DUF3145 family protein n=1 Tax=Aestuariimicrobium sp. T2.26MG-19.2B TaxID=3040679 RepID=UPI00247786FC|nr:DUF3145 family protein [Aestuariimicrobium sp. T2.26MG-19.2B]CAI9411056.1 hypothetical protein AESSP_02570 [Aestuariimicrobium sp. T2.26MG-19.2B]
MISSRTMTDQPVTGVVQIHSTPSALRPHLEWALGGVIGVPTHLEWKPQPVEPNSWRAELAFAGRAGTGARLTSELARWQRVRFDVTETPRSGGAGQRWSVTPSLGVFAAATNEVGDIVVHEDRIRQAMAASVARGTDLHHGLEALLGAPWDAELEPFRRAEDDQVRWLHHVV